jgi:hypothetical protein
VSTWSQAARLPSQQEAVTTGAAGLGLVVVGDPHFGVETGAPWAARPLLEAAALDALDHGAALLFHDLNRLVRAFRFHPRRNPDAVAGPKELAMVRRRHTGRARIATLIPPEATAAEIKAAETARGLAAARQRGVGPGPYCKAEKDPTFLGAVLCLRQYGRDGEAGALWQPKWIAKQLGVHVRTVRNALDLEAYPHGPAWGELEFPYDDFLDLGLGGPGIEERSPWIRCEHCDRWCARGNRRPRRYCSDNCRLRAWRAK